MRLKDADELMRKFESERQYLLSREMFGAEHILVHHAIPLVEDAPAIDAVQVVRCKDCMWYEPLNDCKPFDCEYSGMYGVTKDDFCSYGERKDDD